jgi:hypothetical protein
VLGNGCFDDIEGSLLVASGCLLVINTIGQLAECAALTMLSEIFWDEFEVSIFTCP